MKVLHLTRTGLANAPVLLSDFLNIYGKGQIQSRCIGTAKTSAFTLENNIHWPVVRKNGQRIVKENIEQFMELVKWTDIFHIHNFPPVGDEGLVLIAKSKKPVVFQVHDFNEIYYRIKFLLKYFPIKKILTIAQYQSVFFESQHISVRNILDVNKSILLPVYQNNKKLYVTFSPSNKNLLHKKIQWDYKSYHFVKSVLEKLEKNEKITYKIFNKKGYDESLKQRQNGNIHIDDIYTGSYHLSSLEGLSQGKVVICNLKKWMIDFLKNFLGCSWLPWIIADKKTLEKKIRYYAGHQNEMMELQKESRQWMEKYWSPELVLEDYMKIYRDVLGVITCRS